MLTRFANDISPQGAIDSFKRILCLVHEDEGMHEWMGHVQDWMRRVGFFDNMGDCFICSLYIRFCSSLVMLSMNSVTGMVLPFVKKVKYYKRSISTF